VKGSEKTAGGSPRLRQLAEPLNITGRSVAGMKVSASIGVILVVFGWAVTMQIFKGHELSSGISSFVALLATLVIGLTAVRAAGSALSKYDGACLGARSFCDIGARRTYSPADLAMGAPVRIRLCDHR
jgi:hypothetical protein